MNRHSGSLALSVALLAALAAAPALAHFPAADRHSAAADRAEVRPVVERPDLPMVDESEFVSIAYRKVYQALADAGYEVPGLTAANGAFPYLGSAAVAATEFVSAASTESSGGYRCFPTCSDVDGRFLSIAGTGLETLVGFENVFRIAVDRNATSFELGIFDGDTGGTWDFPRTGSPVQLEFRLYADPNADAGGVGTPLWTASGAGMPDNAWYTATLPTHLDARAPSGHYFYVLHVALPGAENLSVWSNYKLRTTGVLSIHPEVFAYSAFMIGMPEIEILYPNWPDLTVSTFDGTWDFHLDVAQGLQEVVIWDGDFDHGSSDGSAKDTDDWVTGAGTIPPFAIGTQAVGQGVAIGCGPNFTSGMGCPADDAAPGPFQRSPAIWYTFCTPGMTHCYPNHNPSGNREWEMFRIAPDGPAHHNVDLSFAGAGDFHIHTFGVDLTNLNALKFDHDVLCEDEQGRTCTPLRPYLIGDTVFADLNGNGVQDPGEPGIPGVLVERYNQFGIALESAVTDGDGRYIFEVVADMHEVRVDPTNFTAGGPLAGMVSTTGGEVVTGQVVTTNNLDFDFGYGAMSTGGEGCTPGYWRQPRHTRNWVGYSPSDRYNLVFGVPYNVTLQQAVTAGGGGERALGRHAVAALLNAASPKVDYSYTVAEVIAMVQQAYATKKFEKIKDILEAANESGCPL